MARMRTLKPEAASSESLALVDRSVRWTFSMLWTYCDDEGRGVWNARLIKAAIYPLDDDITAAMVEHDLAELLRVGALCQYEVAGKLFLHVPSWHEHQKPNHPVKSKLSPCLKSEHSGLAHVVRSEPAVSPPVQLTPVVVVGEVVGDGGGVVAAPTPAAQKRGTRLDPEWRPSEETRKWTLEHITQAVAAVELVKFQNHWVSKTGRDATKLDWDRTWQNWVLNASGPGSGRASPSRQQQETDDLFDRAAQRMGVAQ